MQNKIIIATFIGCLVIAFSFLAYTEQKNEDINAQNLWFLYFADLKSQSLDFSVENHKNNANFHWEVLADKAKIQEGDLSVKKGETATVRLAPISDSQAKKITIHVTANDNNIKDIYKTF